MEGWIKERLSACLSFDVPSDLIRYINSMENENELQEYLKTLLDFNNPVHCSFATELIKKKANPGVSAVKSKGKKDSRKTIDIADKPVEVSGKKKSKFVNLYSQEGQNRDIVLLKGRHHCDCQASRHKLINNCLKCGRIVCQQEGSGPCLFCGELVCSSEEQQLLNATTKKSTALYNKLMEQKRPQGWEAALAQRNKLLEYDRTSESRTKVMDDDSDYFSNNSVWLSKSEREKLEKYQRELEEKKHASRLKQKITLDFAGRQILEEQNFEGDANEEVVRQMLKKNTISSPSEKTMDASVSRLGSNIHPGVDFIPEFDDSVVIHRNNQPVQNTQTVILRVQDEGLQYISDAGKCLSMHQPWATLLVEGIKIHEGRTWYTSHRGRLWIASTAQQPDTDTIRTVENMYNVIYNDDNLKFPQNYPVGCLLGCVTVDECLPQEEYRERFPEGESDSPYVLICSNPIPLPLRFPIKGKHKIYALEPKIHQAAMKMIYTKSKIETGSAM